MICRISWSVARGTLYDMTTPKNRQPCCKSIYIFGQLLIVVVVVVASVPQALLYSIYQRHSEAIRLNSSERTRTSQMLFESARRYLPVHVLIYRTYELIART